MRNNKQRDPLETRVFFNANNKCTEKQYNILVVYSFRAQRLLYEMGKE